MGINCGPFPLRPLPSSQVQEENPYLPDDSHDPAVARCSECLKRFTADQYVSLIQDEARTLCHVPGCGGEVFFT